MRPRPVPLSQFDLSALSDVPALEWTPRPKPERPRSRFRLLDPVDPNGSLFVDGSPAELRRLRYLSARSPRSSTPPAPTSTVPPVSRSLAGVRDDAPTVRPERTLFPLIVPPT